MTKWDDKLLIDGEDLIKVLDAADEWCENTIDLYKCTPADDMGDDDRDAENAAHDLEGLISTLRLNVQRARADWAQTEAYIDKCIGALDDVMDWVDPEGDLPLEMTTGDAIDRRREALGDNLEAVAECITPRCTECDLWVDDMDEQQLAHHRIYRGMILIACEGYWVINPRALGLEGHENWSGMYETGDEG